MLMVSVRVNFAKCEMVTDNNTSELILFFYPSDPTYEHILVRVCGGKFETISSIRTVEGDDGREISLLSAKTTLPISILPYFQWSLLAQRIPNLHYTKVELDILLWTLTSFFVFFLFHPADQRRITYFFSKRYFLLADYEEFKYIHDILQ